MKKTKEELYSYVDNLNTHDFGQLVIIVANRLRANRREVQPAIDVVERIGIGYLDCPVSPLD